MTVLRRLVVVDHFNVLFSRTIVVLFWRTIDPLCCVIFFYDYFLLSCCLSCKNNNHDVACFCKLTNDATNTTTVVAQWTSFSVHHALPPGRCQSALLLLQHVCFMGLQLVLGFQRRSSNHESQRWWSTVSHCGKWKERRWRSKRSYSTKSFKI